MSRKYETTTIAIVIPRAGVNRSKETDAANPMAAIEPHRRMPLSQRTGSRSIASWSNTPTTAAPIMVPIEAAARTTR